MPGFELFWNVLTADLRVTFFLFLLFAVPIGIRLAKEIIDLRMIRRSGMADIDVMSGVMFDVYLRELFSSQGYKVQQTPARGDYGADLILSDGKKHIAVQAKRYKKNVGVKAVQEVSSAKAYYKADEAWVVTNADYTANAKNLAASNQIRLIGRVELMKMMIAMNEKQAQ
ncbi:restriction endonuclease [Salisediminibacterium selenitireducens]|uniref:Restriction endonuclease n=1 Tax=Bacillus selenitireducens (strain ATCC 700615 / DSM 15326 / MLS10) TaxID=439292 RepID=D6Y011_BACIE|nr:restriction endonuclease [Salisediminibacterium selenitireducens]ADI00513.1 restriction endonuclease [[Bacillus] selenitireducens MLS10]